jgi:amino acid adenylation domain-containing protein
MTGTLTELLAEARSRYPHNLAVEDPLAAETITYAELGERADRLRDLLVGHGVSKGSRIGICAPKSCGTVASIHGTLAAGAAYVPVDSSSPAARISSIFTDCDVSFIVADRRSAASLDGAMPLRLTQIAELEDELVLLRVGEEDGPPRRSDSSPDLKLDDLAYILYTSGSTGKPKGVVHTHSSAASFIDWCSSTFSPLSHDRFSSHAPFHFDLSILDLFVPVRHGASVVLVSEEAGKQPQGLAALIARTRITIWYSTPSILRLLADHGRLERDDFSQLRLVLFAGEVFPVRHLRKLMSLWPSARYFNLYGPTETNVCTWYAVPAALGDDVVSLPIGRVCENDRARVVDAAGEDVPPGGQGELVITGGSVMTGYWNMAERTRESFIEDGNGTRWYRTGDIVSEGREGFAFHGRRDRMVKRRGYRVELGEIEAALSRHPSIGEAAVVALPDGEGSVRIDAFVHGKDAARLSVIQLKQFCSANLPAYMVPDRFVFSHAIPKTSTGKIDYPSLAGAIR